jgi:hypothetical protein
MSKIIDIGAKIARPAVRVAVCVPCQHQVSSQFMFDLVRMMTLTAATRKDIEMRLFLHRGSILPAQRQALVNQALAAEATHILFLDADMRFPKETLPRLLEHNHPIVAANYPTRIYPVRPTATTVEGEKRVPLYTGPESTGLEEASTAGMGCMLVETAVFRNLSEPWFQFYFDESRKHYIGEDYCFCIKATQAGIPIYVDHDLSKEVRHVGEFEFDNSAALTLREQVMEAAGNVRGD